MNTIALLTDFGLDDWYVGSMRAVIAGIAPQARVIDITHAVPAGQVESGAFALLCCYRHFPKGTIFVVVVDPEVGGERRPLACRVDGSGQQYILIGPDNGLLEPVLAVESRHEVRCLENPKLRLSEVSPTFHGRDIFAPAAAHLACGARFEELGPAIDDFVASGLPEPQQAKRGFRGRILYIDHFGNALTNIPNSLLVGAGPVNAVAVGRIHRVPLYRFYSEVDPGRPLALRGSCGFLEIAVNGGSATALLGVKVGDEVVVEAAAG